MAARWCGRGARGTAASPSSPAPPTRWPPPPTCCAPSTPSPGPRPRRCARASRCTPARPTCARLRAAAHGGQALLSRATHALVREQPLPALAYRDLGEHRLRDLAGTEHIYQLVVAGLPANFPPPVTLDARPHN